jgi:ParB-like chromosome segregation protein Spo0J
MIQEIKKEILSLISNKSDDEKIELFNQIKLFLHENSPLINEPVDCVLWVKNTNVFANDYNPNSVAPPEMELLRLSIASDGYTQPIVTMKSENEQREVIDGFHRNRVGKECNDIQERVKGYLPVVTINSDRTDKGDRMAATVRHNRARGKHSVNAMSDIVVELKRRNWTNEKIASHLGMEADEVLRLYQITGLSEIFNNEEFSKAWEIENYGKETI